MPNWCKNEVTVQADDRGKAEAFVDFVRDGDNYFSFNQIVPMPDELKDTNCPSKIVSQEEYDSLIPPHLVRKILRLPSPTTHTSDIGKPITQEMYDRFNKEFGCDNWFDWRVQNWGTKWPTNCSGCDIDDFGGVTYEFDTAWSPPEQIYYRLKELFPKLEIDWFYRVDDAKVSGWL